MFLGVSVEVSELKYPQIIKQKQQTPNSNRHERSSLEYAEHIKENPNKSLLDYHVVPMSLMIRLGSGNFWNLFNCSDVCVTDYTV